MKSKKKTPKRPKAVYLDSAATTRQKPPQVLKAVNDFVLNVGVSHGRGAYRAAIEANELVFGTRSALSKLLHIQRMDRILLMKNVTEAINTALKGYLKSGDHVVLSGLEHNAVIRPLNKLKADRGIDYTLVAANSTGRLNPYDFEEAFKPNTKLVCLTHASNVIGNLSPVEEVGALCAKKGIAFLVDTAQTAGSVPIDMKTMNIDFLAFTGHKGLMGPPGTGGLAVSAKMDLDSFIEGGTGSNSDKEEQPAQWPDKFESGTQNYWGLAGLKAGTEFLLKNSVQAVKRKEEALTKQFLLGVEKMKGVKVYGLPAGFEKDRVGVVSLNVEGWDPSELAYELDEKYGVMVRSGLHCAPLAHRTIGTYPIGTVRFSFGFYNTDKEVEKALNALKVITQS
ncbi:MAG TPA: aminotransferase class V-fold PLP-dependent enzyme [bacterium]|nr:aminotransferase class V-fold PLP-dependent enzyme [bacterium]